MMENFNKAKKLFEADNSHFDASIESLCYISSSESEGLSDEWDSDRTTDTEGLIGRMETEVVSSPKLIAGRIMTTSSSEDLALFQGPSTSHVGTDTTLKLAKQFFDTKLCYASATERWRRHRHCLVIQFSTPPITSKLRTIMSIYLSTKRYTGCLVCGRSVDAIEKENADRYMPMSTSIKEPENVTRLRKEDYMKWLNAGSFLFLVPAVSPARAQG